VNANWQPEVGQAAPPISATTATGDRFELADTLGSYVVIWFFPRAMTPGWCHEAKDFQARKSQFDQLNTVIVGVSADKPELQRTFIEAFSLEFPLIPDPDKHIIDAYGAREVLGLVAKRRTFLVAPDGTIARVWLAVKVEGHADAVLEAVRELSAGAAAK
jgi:thioredoxin-dependent peroxiredoxin